LLILLLDGKTGVVTNRVNLVRSLNNCCCCSLVQALYLLTSIPPPAELDTITGSDIWQPVVVTGF